MNKQSHCQANILFMSGGQTDDTCQRGELERAGLSVTQVVEFIDALSAACNQRIDLAILNLPADDAEATDFPNVLRGVALAAYLPVIIVADSAAVHHRCRFLDAGADDVVSTTTSTLSRQMSAIMSAGVPTPIGYRGLSAGSIGAVWATVWIISQPS